MSHTLRVVLGMLCVSAIAFGQTADKDAETRLRSAALFYASFDDAVKADVAGGEATLSTRFNDEKEKGKFVFEKGFDAKVFRVAKGKGISGGALEAVDVLPRNGRVFFPAKGNIGYRKGGWSGAASLWVNTDPNKLLKTKFCDPLQITHKGAHNGAIWFDFNDAKPRDMRMGAFTALPEGKSPVKEDDPAAPMIWLKGVGFKEGNWHHVVLNWKNFDTGKKDAIAELWVDGKRIGELKDREIGMEWDMDKAGLYVAINYIGLLDEFAIFNRALTAEDITLLHKKPALLAGLKKAPSKPGEE